MATDHTRNKLIDTDDAKWRGYSIDELKYRRAVALVKLEMQKTMLAGSVKSVTNSISDTKARLLGATGKRFEGKLKFVNYEESCCLFIHFGDDGVYLWARK